MVTRLFHSLFSRLEKFILAVVVFEHELDCKLLQYESSENKSRTYC